MEYTELLEKNSEEGKRRLKTVNVSLDVVELGALESKVTNLNLSGFFRDVISRTLEEIELTYWLNQVGAVRHENNELKKNEDLRHINGQA